MRRVLTPLLASVAAAAVFGACTRSPEQAADGNDPLAGLAASAPTTRYTEGFWTAAYRADSAGRPSPWRRALAYCGTGDHPRPGLEADGAKPNCFPVHQVENRTPAHLARERVRQQRILDSLQRQTGALVRAAQERNRRLGF